MKKNFFILIILTIFFFIFPSYIDASYDAMISGDTVRIRSGAGTENSVLYVVNSGTSISVVDKTLYEGTDCPKKWYKITYKEKTGYVCSSYVKFVDNTFTGINVVDWTSRVNANNVAARKGAGTSYKVADTLSLGVNVRIISTSSVNDSKCSTGKWHKIQYYGSKTAYICSKYVTSKEDVTAEDEEYAKTLKEAGFIDSYIPYLTYLHKKYPNWVFIAKKTKTNFTAAVSGEEGKNLMQTKNNNYRTSTKAAEGSSWYKINQGVIAFYLDPRNWLTKDRIFMFEKLDYSKDFASKYPTMIKSIFGSGKLADDKYTTPIFNAGKKNKISPVHIASRIKQEVTSNGSDSTNGTEFTWKGKKYKGYYNFFNIGAYEVTVSGVKYSAITRGLAYAAKLVRDTGSLWNDIEVSITEGSNFLANGYVNKGQGTLYYQKFNVSPDAYYSNYTHQYMTNVQAPATEGNSTYSSYKSSGILSEPIIFEIPVYNNMPEYTSLPASGDNNTNLKNLEIDDYLITPEFDSDVLTYETYIPSNAKEINIVAEAESSKAKIEGAGKRDFDREDTDITITVTAETGDVKKYTLSIKVIEVEDKIDESVINGTQEGPFISAESLLSKANIKTSGNYIISYKYDTTANKVQNDLNKVGVISTNITNATDVKLTGNAVITTGSRIIVKAPSETKTYTFIVNGDSSGDGKISILDLLKVQRHIKGDKLLKGSYLKAADTSGDDKITILDLLKIQKHIKGDKKL